RHLHRSRARPRAARVAGRGPYARGTPDPRVPAGDLAHAAGRGAANPFIRLASPSRAVREKSGSGRSVHQNRPACAASRSRSGRAGRLRHGRGDDSEPRRDDYKRMSETTASSVGLWEKHVMAVDDVTQRLVRITEALGAAQVPFALVGG